MRNRKEQKYTDSSLTSVNLIHTFHLKESDTVVIIVDTKTTISVFMTNIDLSCLMLKVRTTG